MGHILLVDDDDDIRELVILRLEIAGHDVDSATNGKIGLEKALKTNYDLILMDMHMPIMDGHEAIRQLRKFDYKGKIIALTASAMVTEINKAIISGCDDVICKPITEQFEDQIATYLIK